MERREGNGFLTEGEVYRISNGLRCGDTDFIYLAVLGLHCWAGFL